MNLKLLAALVLTAAWFVLAAATDGEGARSPEELARRVTEIVQAGEFDGLLSLLAPSDRGRMASELSTLGPDLPRGGLTGLRIEDDRATGRLGGRPVRFIRIDGSWYLKLQD